MQSKKYNNGFIPTGKYMFDLFNRFIGTCNLIKKFQLPTILNYLSTNRPHNIIDFGCGSGYISNSITLNDCCIYGYDIKYGNYWDEIMSNNLLINFKKINTYNIPYSKNKTYNILFSEVLSEISNIDLFFKHNKELLSRTDYIVHVTSHGRNTLFDILKRLLPYKLHHSINVIRASYLKALNASFRNDNIPFKNFGYYNKYFEKYGFKLIKVDYTFNVYCSFIIQFLQFLLLKTFSFSYTRIFVLLYPILYFVNLIPARRCTDFTITLYQKHSS